MGPRKALISVLQLFAGFSFFAGAAIFFFSLPFLPKVRLRISDLLLASPNVCHKTGAAFMAASIVLLGGFYFLSRGRSLTIRMEGEPRVTIRNAVIQKTLEECLKSHFDGTVALTDLSVLSGSKLAIEVILTPYEENLREALFAEVQKRIAPLLSERFGYAKPFDLIVKS